MADTITVEYWGSWRRIKVLLLSYFMFTILGVLIICISNLITPSDPILVSKAFTFPATLFAGPWLLAFCESQFLLSDKNLERILKDYNSKNFNIESHTLRIFYKKHENPEGKIIVIETRTISLELFIGLFFFVLSVFAYTGNLREASLSGIIVASIITFIYCVNNYLQIKSQPIIHK